MFRALPKASQHEPQAERTSGGARSATTTRPRRGSTHLDPVLSLPPLGSYRRRGFTLLRRDNGGQPLRSDGSNSASASVTLTRGEAQQASARFLRARSAWVKGNDRNRCPARCLTRSISSIASTSRRRLSARRSTCTSRECAPIGRARRASRRSRARVTTTSPIGQPIARCSAGDAATAPAQRGDHTKLVLQVEVPKGFSIDRRA
jgi:hypothetical protein